MSILDELAAHARERVLADSENMSLDILQAMCREKGRANGARFYDALKKDDLSFICEVKKASPSKGVIARDFPYLDIARDYEAARCGLHLVPDRTQVVFGLGRHLPRNSRPPSQRRCCARTSPSATTSSISPA